MWSERAMNCSHQVVTALHFFLASPQHRSRTKSTQENQQTALRANAYKVVNWTWKFNHLKYMPNWPHLSLHDPCRTWLWPSPAGGWTGPPHSSREHWLWSSRFSGREHSLSSCLSHVLNNGDHSETRTGMCYLVGKEDILKWRAHAAHRNKKPDWQLLPTKTTSYSVKATCRSGKTSNTFHVSKIRFWL